MIKQDLDSFLSLSNNTLSDKVAYLLSESIEPVDCNGNRLYLFINELYEHSGLFDINGITYDSVLFTGNDNIYFSYEFNINSSKALAEVLFILSSLQISKTSDNTYELTESSGVTNVLTLRTYDGKEL